jgi:homoserine O-succinyltransferase
MAMLKHFHGVEKHMLPAKAFGCFRHRTVVQGSPFLRGFSDDFIIPVSRWTEVRQAEVDAVPGLVTLLGSAEVGPCLIEDAGHRALYIFNHFEYDSDTLKQEYDRDVAAGVPINVPQNYYPGDDPALNAEIATIMERRLDRDRPLWECWVIEGLADDRWAVLIKVHHALADGAAHVPLVGNACRLLDSVDQ